MAKKILIDGRMYGLENSGIGRYLIHLVEELGKLDKVNTYSILLRRKYFNALNLPKSWTKILLDVPHYAVREQICLTKALDSVKPDLVHFPNFNIPILYTKPFVVTIHDMTMHSQGINATTLPLYKYLFKRLPYKLIFRRAIERSKKIITPSETVKAEIVDYFKVDPKKVIVTYEGLNEKYSFRKKSSKDLEVLAKFGLLNKDYFFYVGNAYPHKNLDRVIQAVVDLNTKRGRKVIFVVAGSRGFFTQRLQEVIDKNRAGNFVKILGFIKDDELAAVYGNSLGFVYASLSEGFGLQGLEALASGTVLLASNTPVFHEIYKDNAYYFNPLDVHSITAAMESVMAMSRESKKEYLSEAQEFIKKYSWTKMAKETLTVYNSVLM